MTSPSGSRSARMSGCASSRLDARPGLPQRRRRVGPNHAAAAGQRHRLDDHRARGRSNRPDRAPRRPRAKSGTGNPASRRHCARPQLAAAGLRPTRGSATARPAPRRRRPPGPPGGPPPPARRRQACCRCAARRWRRRPAPARGTAPRSRDRARGRRADRSGPSPAADSTPKLRGRLIKGADLIAGRRREQEDRNEQSLELTLTASGLRSFADSLGVLGIAIGNLQSANSEKGHLPFGGLRSTVPGLGQVTARSTRAARGVSRGAARWPAAASASAITSSNTAARGACSLPPDQPLHVALELRRRAGRDAATRAPARSGRAVRRARGSPAAPSGASPAGSSRRIAS